MHAYALSSSLCVDRQRRGAEGKLEVVKQVSHENARLQEKLHSYRKEVRQLEASRHARSEEVSVLQAQLRSAQPVVTCTLLLSTGSSLIQHMVRIMLLSTQCTLQHGARGRCHAKPESVG